MIINFGKPKIYKCQSISGVPTGSWVLIDTPREGTTTLNVTKGEELQAKEEGGEIIGRLAQADTYSFEFECFVKKGVALPFTDVDGIITGEWAIKLESAIDSAVPSIQIDRATVNASPQYAVNDSLRVKYTISALKPASGSTFKILTGAVNSGLTLKQGSTTMATEATTSAVTLTAGDVELTVAGTSMDAAVAASLEVGGNIINLTKSNTSTTTSAVFEGVTSAGALTKVTMDGLTLLTLPTA